LAGKKSKNRAISGIFVE